MEGSGGSTVADAEMTDEERRIAEEMEGEPDGDVGEAAEAERRSLADLAAEEPESENEVEQYTLFGTAAKVNAQIKGAGKISKSTIKIASKQLDLPGQFDIDDVIEGRCKLRLDKVEVSVTRDGDGNIKDTKRVHHCTMVAIDQVGDVDDAFAEVDGRPAAE